MDSSERMLPTKSHISSSLPLFSTSCKAFFSLLVGTSGNEARRKPSGEPKEWFDDPDDQELTDVSADIALKSTSCELTVSSAGEVKVKFVNSES
jgi:hypothetical protein